MANLERIKPDLSRASKFGLAKSHQPGQVYMPNYEK